MHVIATYQARYTNLAFSIHESCVFTTVTVHHLAVYGHRRLLKQYLDSLARYSTGSQHSNKYKKVTNYSTQALQLVPFGIQGNTISARLRNNTRDNVDKVQGNIHG